MKGKGAETGAMECNMELIVVPGEKKSETMAGVPSLAPKHSNLRESAYNRAEPKTQGRNLRAKIKYRRA